MEKAMLQNKLQQIIHRMEKYNKKYKTFTFYRGCFETYYKDTIYLYANEVELIRISEKELIFQPDLENGEFIELTEQKLKRLREIASDDFEVVELELKTIKQFLKTNRKLKLPYIIRGKEFNIAVNPQFLINGIELTESTKVILGENNTSALKFLNDTGTVQYICVPMRIK